METKELMTGNYVMHGGRWTVVDNIHPKSVNVDIRREGEGGFAVARWINAGELSTIPLTTAILEDLGFRYFHQRYVYPEHKGRAFYIVRRGEDFYLAIDQDWSVLTEIKGVHHLQNMMRTVFGLEVALRRNRRKYIHQP